MDLDVSWGAVEDRLLEIAERLDAAPNNKKPDHLLLGFELVVPDGQELQLTDSGMALYEARFVLQSPAEIKAVLRDLLTARSEVTAFCEALWGRGSVQVSGAVSLLKRITRSSREASAKRWIELMSKAGLIDYNRNKPTLRVTFNPRELATPDDTAKRERTRGHVLGPDTPYGNLLAFRDLLDSARGSIRWYEQHLPPKAMEMLYRQVDGSNVSEIRLLSGPDSLTEDAKKDYKRFRSEMAKSRGISVEWRVLDKNKARQHHDRFLISDGQSKNLPPLNTILANSTGEILESEVGTDDFDGWWADGEPLEKWAPPAE